MMTLFYTNRREKTKGMNGFFQWKRRAVFPFRFPQAGNGLTDNFWRICDIFKMALLSMTFFVV